MSNITISVDSLSEAITAELKNYNQEVIDGVKNAAYEFAQEFTSATKKDAPRSDTKRRGRFAKNITFKKTYDSNTGATYTWYVKDPEYRLTHLLKNGHATKNGGRTRAQDFITNNYNRAEEKYVEEVEEIIKNGS